MTDTPSTVRPELLELLRCPACGGTPLPEREGLRCACGQHYRVEQGIPVMLDVERLGSQAREQATYFTREFREMHFTLEEWHKSYVSRFVDTFSPAAGALVLDCGTGSGYMSIELARLGCRCLACDLTMENLLKLAARARAEGVSDLVMPVCCDAERLPFADDIARYFISNAVLEHLADEAAAVAEIDRVCGSPAGLMVTVPLRYRYLNPLFAPVNFVHDRRIGHLRRYDKQSLRTRFSAWSLTRTYYTGHLTKVAKALANMVSHRYDEQAIEAADLEKQAKRWGASNIISFFER